MKKPTKLTTACNHSPVAKATYELVMAFGSSPKLMSYKTAQKKHGITKAQKMYQDLSENVYVKDEDLFNWFYSLDDTKKLNVVYQSIFFGWDEKQNEKLVSNFWGDDFRDEDTLAWNIIANASRFGVLVLV